MAFGLGQLHLSPRDFWAMTPRELAAAGDGVFGPRVAPPSRGELDEMIARYPDRERTAP